MPIITPAARCLEETVRSGSIRKAAEVLNLSASAVNRHILNLEAEYGIALLERLPRGVVATEAGQLLVARVREWRSEMVETSQQLNRLRGKGHQNISIGLNECVADELFPTVMAAVHETSPNVTFAVTVGGSDDLTADLIAGKLDAVVAFNLRRSADFWIVGGVTMPVGLVTSNDHQLAGQTQVTLADCAGFPLILADGSLTLRPLLDAIFDNSSGIAEFPVTSNSINVIKAAVRRGQGISLLTALDVAWELRSGALRYIQLAGADLVETLSIGVRDGKDMPAAVRLFCSEMEKAIAVAATAAR